MIELTTNPEALFTAQEGDKVFVNSREMIVKFHDERIYLEAEVEDYMETLYQISWYNFVNLRHPFKNTNILNAICNTEDKDGEALMPVQEMVDLIKSGNFQVC